MTEEEFRAAVMAEVDTALEVWKGAHAGAPQNMEEWIQMLRKYAPFGGILEDLVNTWY